MLLFSASASRHFINSIDSKGIRSPGRSNKLFRNNVTTICLCGAIKPLHG